MAINAYLGTPGSGKTYEVIKSVILNAFVSGRSIVTNIEGVEEDKFIEYSLNELGKERDSLGKITKVTDDEVLKDNFFPFKGSKDDETIAKRGDLICLDEIWRIFDDSKKITENQKSFVAEHRHFVNDIGQTCDLVVINQSAGNIPKFIKDRVEQSYVISKLKSLGLNSRYRVDVYTTAKLFKKNFVTQYQEKYDTKIFNLYNSYDGTNAKETNIDERGNLLKSRWFIIKFVLALIMIAFGITYMYLKYGNETDDKQGEQIKPQPEKVIENAKVTREEVKTTESKSAAQKKSYKVDYSNVEISKEWRIVGEYKKNNVRIFILSDKNGNLRNEPANETFSGRGNLSSGIVDGKKVTYFSGRKERQGYFRNEDY